VGCGMIMASQLSHYLGYITTEQLSEINHTIDAFGLPIIPPQSMTTEQWLDAMGRDKKNHDQNIRFIVLTSIGSAKIISLSVKQTTDFLETVLNY
jgi:3-dehydroquinate synthase